MSDETLAQKLTGREDGTPEQAQEMVNALAEAASLAESQNQALQEELAALKRGHRACERNMDAEIARLQERAEKAEAALRAKRIKELEVGLRKVRVLAVNGSYDDGSMLDEIEDIATQLLSPTQETDPE